MTDVASAKLGYENLLAWRVADEFAHEVYDLTFRFPKEELFGLTSQLRRAVLSVPCNIVEGFGRNSKKEFHRFLSISLGSLAETGYLLDFAFKRGYISKEDMAEIAELKNRVGKIIWKFYSSLS